MMIGTGTVLPTKDKEEGALVSSIVTLNGFLTYLACFHVRQSAVTISSSYSLLGLMMNTQALLLFTTALFMLGIKVCSDLFQKIVDEGLHNKRPPEITFKTKYKVKTRTRKIRSKLMPAVMADD